MRTPGPLGADAPAAATDAIKRSQCGTAWLLAVGVLTVLLCLPFIRIALGEEDGIWLNAAARLRQGQVLYRDFFQFIPPLSFLLVDGWTSVLGHSLEAARLLAILAIAGSACFTFLACRCATGHAGLSAALPLAWVVSSQGAMTQVNHHWFALFFSAVAAWASMSAVQSGRTGIWRPALAGLACGAAGMVTQTQGALALLASATVFLDPRRPRREVLVFLIGVAVVPAGLVVRTAWQGALADAFESVILFTIQRYSAIQHRPYGFGMDLQTYPAVLLYPACVLALVVLAWHRWRAVLGDKPLLACIAFGLIGLVGAFPRADVWHINFTLPLALPLAGRCAVLLAASWVRKTRRVARIAAACFMGPAALYFVLLFVGSLYMPVTQTAAGPVQFLGWGGRPDALARLASLPPTDRIFFYPYSPLLPYLAGRVQVSRYDLFLPSYTTVEQYRNACLSVMRDADWLLLHRYLMTTDYFRRDYAAMPNPTPPERVRFEQVLEIGFTPSSKYGDYELLRRTDAAGPGLCEDGWP